jgi:hypothetical protein
MSRLHVGGKVQIISAIPGFHLQMGIVTEITEPFVSGAQAREEALRELRLYVVRLDDGRHFRFRGKELLALEGQDVVQLQANPSEVTPLLKASLRRTG